MTVSRNVSVAPAVNTSLVCLKIIRNTIAYANINYNVLILPCILSIAIFCLNILHFDIFSIFLHLHAQKLHVSNCPLNLSKLIIIHNKKILIFP